MKPFLHFVFFCVLLFSCCKPDNNCEDAKNTVVDLRSDELEKVPYTGFDTLYFLNQTGDTSIVRGTGKIFSYDTEHAALPPDCPQNETTQYQSYIINFSPIKGQLSFTLQQKKLEGTLVIRKSDYPIYFTTLYGTIGVVYTNNPYYLDSVEINSIFYKKIKVMVPRINPPLSDVDTTYEVLYNQSHGILRIKNKNSGESYISIEK